MQNRTLSDRIWRDQIVRAGRDRQVWTGKVGSAVLKGQQVEAESASEAAQGYGMKL